MLCLTLVNTFEDSSYFQRAGNRIASSYLQSVVVVFVLGPDLTVPYLLTIYCTRSAPQQQRTSRHTAMPWADITCGARTARAGFARISRIRTSWRSRGRLWRELKQ